MYSNCNCFLRNDIYFTMFVQYSTSDFRPAAGTCSLTLPSQNSCHPIPILPCLLFICSFYLSYPALSFVYLQLLSCPAEPKPAESTCSYYLSCRVFYLSSLLSCRAKNPAEYFVYLPSHLFTYLFYLAEPKTRRVYLELLSILPSQKPCQVRCSVASTISFLAGGF